MNSEFENLQSTSVRIADAWARPELLAPLIGKEGYGLPDISGHTWHRIGSVDGDNWYIAPPGISPDRFHFEFSGQHNAVIQGHGSIMRGRICMPSNCATLIIGENSGHGSDAHIAIYGNGHGGVFFLGGRTSSNQATFFLQGNGIRLVIGEDCMFAHAITCRTDDDHAIFNMSDSEHLNPAADIYISPHVWICPEVTVLRGVTIGFGSVIGIKSLVNRSIPAFCLAGGAPAKVLRQDISWDRQSTPPVFARNSLIEWFKNIKNPEANK